MYSYIFALSSRPVPRLIERIHGAVDAGHSVAVVYLKRPGPAVKVGEIRGADIIPIEVPFRAAQFDRVLAFPRLVIALRKAVFSRAQEQANVYIDSLDLLAAACFWKNSLKLTLRFEVRDLHHHQLSAALSGRMVRAVERRLIAKVDLLIVTSMAYYEQYYRSIFSGPVVLLENLPDPEVWDDFEPQPVRASGAITIGLVGAIRYGACVLALIEGARIARSRGADIRLKIAGPDMEGCLHTLAEEAWILRSGPFDYVKEIKDLYSDVDLIWSVYDTRIQNVRLALSNKFYEAMLSGIPVIAARNTFLGDRIVDLGIGSTVEGRSPNSIADLLCSLHEEHWYAAARRNLLELKDHLDEIYAVQKAAVKQGLFA